METVYFTKMFYLKKKKIRKQIKRQGKKIESIAIRKNYIDKK